MVILEAEERSFVTLLTFEFCHVVQDCQLQKDENGPIQDKTLFYLPIFVSLFQFLIVLAYPLFCTIINYKGSDYRFVSGINFICLL